METREWLSKFVEINGSGISLIVKECLMKYAGCMLPKCSIFPRHRSWLVSMFVRPDTSHYELESVRSRKGTLTPNLKSWKSEPASELPSFRSLSQQNLHHA